MWHRKKLTNDIKGKKGERYFKDNLTAYSRSPTVWLHNLKYLTYWDPPFVSMTSLIVTSRTNKALIVTFACSLQDLVTSIHYCTLSVSLPLSAELRVFKFPLMIKFPWSCLGIMFKMSFSNSLFTFSVLLWTDAIKGEFKLKNGKKFLNDTSLKENFKAEFKCSYFLLFYVFLLFL